MKKPQHEAGKPFPKRRAHLCRLQQQYLNLIGKTLAGERFGQAANHRQRAVVEGDLTDRPALELRIKGVFEACNWPAPSMTYA